MRQAPVLHSERIVLRIGEEGDVPEVLRYYTENREHLDPWEPLRPAEFYTEGFMRNSLALAWEAFRADRGLRLLLFRPGEKRVLGSVSFSAIVRGVFHSCFLGYAIAAEAQGQGLMAEALRLAIAYAFDELNLHRISANYVPGNERSGVLLRRLGFTVEGYARDYLMIQGRWQDHILTALYNPSWKPPA